MFSFYANLRNLKCSSRFIFSVMGRISRIKMKKYVRIPQVATLAEPSGKTLGTLVSRLKTFSI